MIDIKALSELCENKEFIASFEKADKMRDVLIILAENGIETTEE